MRKKKGAGKGAHSATSLPKGTLREQQWAALAKLYAAGQAGIEAKEFVHGPGGFARRPTLTRLENFRPQPLIEVIDRGGMIPRSYFRLTAFGIEYYEREWRHYRELYPNLDMPTPRSTPPTK